MKDIKKLWHSLERTGPHADEALVKFCQQGLMQNKKTILDIGSGGSHHTACLKKVGFNVETIDLAKKRKPTYIGDYNKFDFPKQFERHLV